MRLVENIQREFFIQICELFSIVSIEIRFVNVHFFFHFFKAMSSCLFVHVSYVVTININFFDFVVNIEWFLIKNFNKTFLFATNCCLFDFLSSWYLIIVKKSKAISFMTRSHWVISDENIIINVDDKVMFSISICSCYHEHLRQASIQFTYRHNRFYQHSYFFEIDNISENVFSYIVVWNEIE